MRSTVTNLVSCKSSTPHPNPLPTGRGDKASIRSTVNGLPSYHPTILPSSKRIAFTLAEVLITLGIIGVVAAVTMPVLIAKYQEHVLRQQFKKAYSVLSQAWNNVFYEFGMIAPQCGYISGSSNIETTDCDIIRESLFKNLKIIKTCNSKSYENGCIPKYKGFDTMAIERYPDKSEEDAIASVKAQPGFFQNAILNYAPSYVLADGTIILLYAQSSGSTDYFPALFAVDVNGKKGPNKWGYDLFALQTVSNKSYYRLIPIDYAVETGGKVTSKMLISN